MYMTMAEIDQKYDGEWVYIINLISDENNIAIGGEVAAHSENREKVIQAMLNTPDGGIYIKYAGKMPEGVSILL